MNDSPPDMQAPPAPSHSGRQALAALLSHAFPALLTVVALLAAALGQRRFESFRVAGFSEGALLREGLLLYISGAISLLLARVTLRLPGDAPTATTQRGLPGHDDARPALRQSLRWPLASLGLGLALLLLLLRALAALPMPPPADAPYALFLVGWLLAIVLVGTAWLEPLPLAEAGPRLRGWLRARWQPLAALAAITLLGAWLRLDGLASVPFTIGGDEGSIGLDVRRIVAGELRHPFIVMWGTHSTLAGFILSLFARLFGPGIGALRLFVALLGIAALPAVGALGWRIGGWRVGLAAALLLATFPMHIHFSRVLLLVSWDPFSYVATFALLLWGLRGGARWPFVAAGLVAGLGQYAYTGARLLPVILLAFVGYLAIVHPARLRAQGTRLALLGLLFVVVASPLYLHGLRFPAEFNARLNQEGILQNGWLQNEMSLRGEGALPILWDQARRTLFGWAFFPDRSAGWNPGAPLAVPLLALGLFLGLALTVRRWREPDMALLHLWFWGFIFSAGMLTVNPPTSNRLAGATPVVCLLAALGWQAVAEGLARGIRAAQRRAATWLCFGLALAAIVTTQLSANARFQRENRFAGPNALAATMLGRDLARTPTDTTLVVLGAPSLASNLSPLAFLTPHHRRLDLVEPLVGPPTTLPADGDLLFAITPERLSDLNVLLQAFPQAELRDVLHPQEERLLFYELRVER